MDTPSWIRHGLTLGILLLVVELSLLHAAETPSAADQASPKETWNVIYLGGGRIGYSRSSLQKVTEEGQKRFRTESDTYMLIKRFGQELTTRSHLETTETEEGELLRFRFELQNPPAKPNLTIGSVRGETLHLQTTTAGKTVEKESKWDTSLKSPAWQDRLLQESPLKAGEKRSFKAYLPELNKVATVQMHAHDFEEVALLDGKKRKLLKVSITQSVLPGITTTAWLDDEGSALKTTIGFLGMETYLVSREEALKSIEGKELDVALDTLVKVGPIEDPHRTSQIVYRVKLPNEDPTTAFTNGSTQKVRRIEDTVAEIVVTSRRPPVATPATKVEVAPEFLQPTRYLQSDHERVIEHARQAAGEETDPWKVAVRLERYVHDKLTKKNFSTALASAAEVAESLEGDCTEHACLLAAMARAREIPSRIVVGLVYVRRLEAFGGHMWTEVFINGEWIPLDATLAQGGIGAAHLRMADSSFADDGPTPVTSFIPLLTALGKMQIEVQEVKHAEPQE